jgi:predicted Na+-dependent transporter
MPAGGPPGSPPTRALAAAPRILTPLALVAAALALLAPSSALAARSDLLLTLLVLATALGISFADLRRLRDHAAVLAFLSVAPLVVLGALAWVIGRPFAPPVRDGLLAVGLASSEVASVGLVAIAGAGAAIALGAVSGSLVASALLGPLAASALAGGSAHASPGPLLARFALVVIVPLVMGVAARSRWPRVAAADPEREGVAALTVAVLIYAALSGARGAHDLGGALLASVIFLAVSVALAEVWRRRAGPATAVPGAFAIAMRDFAVAAALAAQAFGIAAGAVPGVYGVVMLVAGTIAAGRLARSRQREPRSTGGSPNRD